MALDDTTLTIDEDGNPEQSTGLPLRIYNALIATYAAFPAESTPDSQRQLADLCNAIGGAVVAEVTANAEVRITDSDAGLQRMPASTAEDEPTKAPATTKTLSVF
jgi:hypothetical protein